MAGNRVEVSAPGKVILHGEHSVMYGKTALAVALGLRSTVIIEELSKTAHPTLHIKFPNVALDENISLETIFKSFTATGEKSWKQPSELNHEKHLQMVEDVLRTIREDYESLASNQQSSLRVLMYAFTGIFVSSGLTIGDFSIEATTELTVGAGTGSSASFAVCLCGAMVQLVKLKSGGVGDLSDEEKKIVSAWAFNCEKITHGAPSGVDNTTCTYGSLVSFRKGEEPRLLPSPELRVLLVDSRVGRQTSKLIAGVVALKSRNKEAVDHIMNAMDHVALTAAELLEELSLTKSPTETDIVYDHLHELWTMNHCLLAALGVSHPALETIRFAASKRGFACKLTGAGGGGNAIVLIPPSAEETKVEELKAELLENGFRVTDTLVGGTGIQHHGAS